MRTVLSLLFVFVLLLGCKSKEPENITVIKKNPIRFLALGDSYTIGESVEFDQRWPMQLAQKLREDGFKIEEPRIIAQTGWTTGDLLEAIDMQLNNEKFEMVSVLIGVNNQYQGKSIEDYEKDLHKVFNEAVAHSKYGAAGVFALSIPDYGATPFGAAKEEEIGRELDEFNRVFKKVASEYNIQFFDITPISREAKENPELIAEDNLHPSGLMYREWVELIYPEIKKLASKV